MKILVFSDSHGYAAPIQKAITLHPDATVILHAGDGAREFDYITAENPSVSCVGVPGNCDFFTGKNPSSVTLDLDGIRVFLTHGHRFSVKSGYDALISHACENDIDIAVFGHTHIPLDRYIDEDDGKKPLRLFNPGSIGHPMGTKATYGIIEIRKNGILTSIAEL
ncbi:MAG: metallophosphoesterase [Clostridia bacterium]|nr:metallophosphoesterase [Clostridia bacterium]